jgi:cyclophilin family peptidyl-prolyl cis-trans isomerase
VFRRSALLLCTLALGLAACGGGGNSSSSSSGGGGATATTDTQAQDGAGGQGGSTCAKASQPRAKPDGGASRPKGALDPKVTYDVVLKTSCGEITIRLDQKTSPRTAASFAGLVKSGFLDNTVFHRIVPGFVVQGGDPTASGTGGPGYSTRDTPPKGTRYTKGTVAMAKTPAEAPGTAGSQFYIVTAPDAGLPPEYALLGRVVKGQDVVDAIGQLGDPASGQVGTPVRPVVIERATLRQR